MNFKSIAVFGGVALLPVAGAFAATNVPNIVFFLADDMGIGDTSAYQDLTGNPDYKQVYTPQMNRLAEKGTRFTDVHAPEGLCTPTRLALLTGIYSFRSPIVQETSSEGQDIYGTLFPGQRRTIPAMLKQFGYRTYGIGKWHLALQGDKYGTGLVYEGPLECGFDRYTGTPGNFGNGGCMMRDHGYMWFNSSDQLVPINDPAAINWGADNNPVMLKKIQPANLAAAKTYLNEHISNTPSQPFFMYYASHANHTPWVSPDALDGHPLTTNVTVAGTMLNVSTIPDNDGDGIPEPSDPDYFIIGADATTNHWDPYYKTNSVGAVVDNGPTTRAKMVVENDIIVGDLLDFLEATDDPRNPGRKLIDNTIFIFTSDNGADIESKLSVGALLQKSGGAITSLQGKKATRWEGGTRIPFIAVWPGRIATNATSDALFGLNDMYATFSKIVGHALAPYEAVDSESVLGAWTNGTGGVIRQTDLIYKNKENLLVRRGDIKLMTEDPNYTNKNERFDSPAQGLDFSNMTAFAMYNLSNDLGEAASILASQSALSNSMQSTVRQFVDQGYSRSGAQRVYNGPNFQGGNMMDINNWHHYTWLFNNQLPTTTRPGFICVDGTTASSLSNMFLLQRAGAIAFTGSSESQRQINNTRWDIEAGSLNFSNGTLYLAKGTSTLTVTEGSISGAQLDFGSAAGSTAGSKTVVLGKGSGVITLDGQLVAPAGSAPISIVSEADQVFSASAGTITTSRYSNVSVQSGDVIVLTSATNKKGSTVPLHSIILGGTAGVGAVTALYNGLDTYPTSWGWYYTVTNSGTLDLGVITDSTNGITAGTACYVLRSSSGEIELAGSATWDDIDGAANLASYSLNYSFTGKLTNGVLIETISSLTDTITKPASYTEDFNSSSKRVIVSFDGITNSAWTSTYTLSGGTASKLTSGALGMVFRGVAASGFFSNVVPLVFGNDGDATNDYISFTSGTRGKIVSKQNSAFYESLWTNGHLRVDGQSQSNLGGISFAAAGFLSLNYGNGTYVLILDAGQIIDDDNDGINDTWEQRRAGAVNLLSATGDYDNDGLLDITEYILDYDPLVSSQNFSCSAKVDVQNLNYVISFNATNSRMYRVEYKTNLLSSATWQFLSWQTGSNGLHTFRAPADTTKGFFRMQVLAP